MKTFQLPHRKFIVIAIASIFVATSLTTTASPVRSISPPLHDNARLVVWRAADFGTLIYLTLFIDRVQVTTLGRNQGYEAIIHPGRHILSIGTSPSPYGKTRFTHLPVTVRGGETYKFTALWKETDRAALEPARALAY